MNRVVDVTVDALQRVGDAVGRRLGGDNRCWIGSRRPLDGKGHRNKVYAAKHSSDNLAASPGYSSFNNYRQRPQGPADGYGPPPFGTGLGGPLNYPYGANSSFSSPYPGGFAASAPALPYGALPPGSVGYAPDYYIAERREVELVPAPPPRYIPQPVPVPFPVDRPVPQPYPVEVFRPIPVDRPVPVPVPSPVPVDRPVPVPVPVPVPSPPPAPVCVPYPVCVPTPCYVPVGVPVPSPVASPVMFEQKFSHRQRWIAGSPAFGANPYLAYGGGSFIR